MDRDGFSPVLLKIVPSIPFHRKYRDHWISLSVCKYACLCWCTNDSFDEKLQIAHGFCGGSVVFCQLNWLCFSTRGCALRILCSHQSQSVVLSLLGRWIVMKLLFISALEYNLFENQIWLSHHWRFLALPLTSFVPKAEVITIIAQEFLGACIWFAMRTCHVPTESCTADFWTMKSWVTRFIFCGISQQKLPSGVKIKVCFSCVFFGDYIFVPTLTQSKINKAGEKADN